MDQIKRIVAHVEGGSHDAAVLRLAGAVATRFGASVEAVFANVPPYVPATIDGILTPQIIETQRALYVTRAAVAKAAVAKLALPEARRSFVTVKGLAAPAVIQRGRAADLVVVAQPAPEESDAVTDYDLPAEIVMSVGRPVLIVPYAGDFADCGKRILVAWSERREAARALSDSLPFLASASEVTLLSVNPGDATAALEAGAKAWLAAHGIKGNVRTAHTKEIEVSDVLLSTAADISADLVVMGAYGRSRFRELILGGATHDILKHMTAPVLMSH